MIYRPLGRTGLNVSAIALGTVELGMDYGISAPGEFGRPDNAEAMRLLKAAVESGINLFDTAPAYGESERLLGEALEPYPDCLIATKVAIPRDENGARLHGEALRQAVHRSIEASLRSLRREALDVVQIHNATVDVLNEGEMADALLAARDRGWVRFLGATVYTEAEALAAIDAGCFDVLQVAYNVLDQRMARRVFPAAERAGVGIVARSALLKGALTPRARWLPGGLAELRQAAERVMSRLAGTWELLPEVALRFCLFNPSIAAVLVGARTGHELKQALAAVEAGPLPGELLAEAHLLALADERLLNPSLWPAT